MEKSCFQVYIFPDKPRTFQKGRRGVLLNQDAWRELLIQVKRNKLSINDALKQIKTLPFEDLGYAKIDHHRALRSGFPEVIYCPGKHKDHIVEIFKRLAEKHTRVLATRANPEIFTSVRAAIPEVRYNELAKTISLVKASETPELGQILVISAGTADLPIAEEAYETALIMGNRVERLYDVGVAGIHRLLENLESLNKANVIIVVAGMEGALASVIGGLVYKPLIAVPTSVGYGANFQGLSALLAMLTSCASGVTVVNIDNGFGAGYAASLINRSKEER